MQRGSPPPLLPLLRSKLQAEVLALVLLGPEQEWSLTDLASRAGVSVSSVQREVDRAEQAGVVSSRRLGSTRLVKAADSPLTGPLAELLLRSFSRLRRARNGFEYPSTQTPGPSDDDVQDAIRVAREVNDAAGKILESGVLTPW